MFEVKGLSIGYKAKYILLKNINFNVKKGTLTVILGRNGTGKTTLLKTLTGFLQPLSGDIFFENENTQNLSARQLAKKMSIVSTERVRVDYLSVMDFLQLGRFPYSDFLGKLKESDQRVIQQVIEQVHIQNLIKKNLSALSDGELQKVLIARALVQDTPLVLLDEPTTHLDLVNRFQIFQLIKQLSENTDKSFIVSSHEVELALHLADTIILINEGQVEVGTPLELIESGSIAKAFEQEGVSFNREARRFEISR